MRTRQQRDCPLSAGHATSGMFSHQARARPHEQLLRPRMFFQPLSTTTQEKLPRLDPHATARSTSRRVSAAEGDMAATVRQRTKPAPYLCVTDAHDSRRLHSAEDGSPEPATAPRGPRSVSPRVYAPTIAATALLAVAAIVTQESGYLSVSPGPTWPVEVAPAAVDPQYDPERWRLLSVAVSEATWIELAAHRVLGDGPVVSQRRVGPVGESETAQMIASSRVAAAVAATVLDPQSAPRPAGVVVLAVQPGSPAEVSGISVGDVVVAADGRPVSAPDALSSLSRSTPHELTLRRSSGVVDATVTPSSEGMGITIATYYEGISDLPMPQTPSGVGGASGGLIYSIALVDAAEPGDLSGGRTVAATGALLPAGEVLPVLGVAEKVRAAAEAGASLIFVPMSSDVGTPPPGVEIVEVARTEDAITYLCATGGEGQVCDRLLAN